MSYCWAFALNQLHTNRWINKILSKINILICCSKYRYNFIKNRPRLPFLNFYINLVMCCHNWTSRRWKVSIIIEYLLKYNRPSPLSYESVGNKCTVVNLITLYYLVDETHTDYTLQFYIILSQKYLFCNVRYIEFPRRKTYLWQKLKFS